LPHSTSHYGEACTWYPAKCNRRGWERECAPGEEGNIALEIRSPNEPETFFGIFDGYIDENGCVSRPEHQFVVNGKTETWYLTGDKGKKDEMGYFWFVGRADDEINSAGYRIGKSYAKSICV